MSDALNRRELLAGATAGMVTAGAGSLLPVTAAANETLPPNLPTDDPCAVYPEVPGIGCDTFRLRPTGLTTAQRQWALRGLLNYQTRRRDKTLGFQANQAISYEADLRPFLNYHINNVGDPFQSGSFTLNSKWMERAVLDYYARLWHARWPHNPRDPESYWGYVLTMGSTEGNLYGLWNGRDYLEGKCLLYHHDACGADGQADGAVYHQAVAPADNPHAFTPVAFYSEDTHYSIIKAIRVLGIHSFYEIGANQYPGQCPITADKAWPREVPSTRGGGGPGSIDIDALTELVEFFAAKGYPILINLNFGTTFKGAYDDVERAGERLMPVLKKYGLWEREIAGSNGQTIRRQGYWVHVDGALAASYMPFIEMAYDEGRMERRGPNFDFRLPIVSSLTMSGHKWIGAPWPCGVYMSKTKYLLQPPSRPNYIGSRDSTLAGSRNGFSAMILWDYLARHSYEKQIAKAMELEELADYACQQLKSVEDRRGPMWVARTPLALTIRFRRPQPEIVFKYSLANETLYVEGERRDYSHIYIMEHVTQELIDELVSDLDQPHALAEPIRPDASGQVAVLPTASPGFRPLIYVPESGRGMRG